MRALAWYLPAALWAAGLLLLGSLPASTLPSVDLPLDKLAHFVLFGVLGVLVAVGWKRAGRRPPYPWALMAMLAVGAADEWHQAMVPGRSREVADWAMDAAGAALGFALVARSGAGVDTEEGRAGNES